MYTQIHSTYTHTYTYIHLYVYKHMHIYMYASTYLHIQYIKLKFINKLFLDKSFNIIIVIRMFNPFIPPFQIFKIFLIL